MSFCVCAFLMQVAEEYTRLKPRNPLARFIPALKKLAGRGDRFTGLEGFEDEVRKLKSDAGEGGLAYSQTQRNRNSEAMLSLMWCGARPPSWPSLPHVHAPTSPLPSCSPPPFPRDPEFIKAQWTVCHNEYDVPATRWCQKIKCNLAVTKAQLHDALVNVSVLV